jgi:hypothetical protein
MRQIEPQLFFVTRHCRCRSNIPPGPPLGGPVLSPAILVALRP